jgi:Omp85 superfamily domain
MISARSRIGVLILPLLAAAGLPAEAQTPPPAAQQPPPPILESVALQGVTVYSRDDVIWMLRLREGAALPDPPEALARELQRRYDRDGYIAAHVDASLTGGHLTLTAQEGRIDEIEILGVSDALARRLQARLSIQPGDIYNERTVGRAVKVMLRETGGALTVREPDHAQASGGAAPEHPPDTVGLDPRGGRNVLVIPLHKRQGDVDVMTGTSSREDFFNPVDGFAPAIGFTGTVFDHAKFNHTFLAGYVSYKFARDTPGYSFGLERPLFRSPKLFLGGEVHDMTASDDMWRLSTVEQSLVALTFQNTYRDYYRRRGIQAFAALRAGEANEFNVIARWDRHEPLRNMTEVDLFREFEDYRPNAQIAAADVNSIVLGYTFDMRGLTGPGVTSTYERHLKDGLFGFGRRQQPGVRVEWTSEIAGHGLGGDQEFDRHILNARGYLPLSGRQLVSGRGLFGFSHGTLPIERQFAIGGIGSVRGYRFKEESGTGLALMNVEYALKFGSGSLVGHDSDGGIRGLLFYDAGRVTGALPGSTGHWLQGIGVGFAIGDLRVEFGYRANDIPGSLQVLVRLNPNF